MTTTELPKIYTLGKVDPQALSLLLQERDELRAENESIRTLMNMYNLGGWTDSLTLIQERDALRAENAKLQHGKELALQYQADAEAERDALRAERDELKLRDTLFEDMRQEIVYLKAELEAAKKDAARMKFLHSSNYVNGYEWGIFKVKWKHGRPDEVLHIMQDNSDLDEAMKGTT